MTNRLLLATIALGLWANVAVSLVKPAGAQPGLAGTNTMNLTLGLIEKHLDSLVSGSCINQRLC